MTEILALRQEEAQLLGYDNFGQVSLVPRWPSRPSRSSLPARPGRSAPGPCRERRGRPARLCGRAPGPQGSAGLGLALHLRSSKEARYAFSEQEVKQYFTAPKVLAGLFKIIETLFDVAIRRDQAPVWNEAVEFYRIERRPAGGPVLPRPAPAAGKRGGAWMDDDARALAAPDTGWLQTPVAHLVCNFAEA